MVKQHFLIYLQEQTKKIHGMDVIIVTTASTDEEAKALLKGLGLPFAKNNNWGRKKDGQNKFKNKM